MPEDIQVSMFEVVGGPLCVASSDGQKVYNRLAAAIDALARLHAQIKEYILDNQD